jgi:hypothetical protein
MNQPPLLGVVTPSGEISWYRILGMQAGSTSATKSLTVAGGDWLDMGMYRAILVDGGNRTAGSFAVIFCMSNQEPLTYVGTWRADYANAQSG